MIDFKTHITLFKRLSSDDDVDEYLKGLELTERLKITRDLNNTYPIKDGTEITSHILDNFSVLSNVEEAVLGQFIMLEQIITGKTKFEDDQQRDLEFAKLLLRPKHHNEFDNEKEEEEYKNEQKILSSPVQDIYNVINKYLLNRDYVLFKQFAGVFYEIPDEEEDEEEKETKTNEHLFESQWYWYSMVRMLAKEDVTRYNEIYMLKMSTVLPEMSYITQKEKIEQAHARKQRALNKL